MGNKDKANELIYSFFRDKFYNKFEHVHCPSKFIAEELQKHGYTSNFHVISNGISKDFKYIKKEKPKELEGKYVITMAGRLSNEKRQDVLIDAINRSKYRDNIQLVLAGQGPKRKKYIELGKTLKNKPLINFLSKEKLIELFSITDLYVHASDIEIEAISCIEAFACGLVPIIANSKKSATSQFALDDRSLFEAGNAQSLADKIDYWIEHEKEKKQMEMKYAESADKYSIDKSMENIERMFEDAIKDYKSKRK